MDWRPISADSHITEPPGCYVDNIDPAWREKAPHVVYKEGMGDIYVVDGMKTPVPMGLIAGLAWPGTASGLVLSITGILFLGGIAAAWLLSRPWWGAFTRQGGRPAVGVEHEVGHDGNLG